MVRSANSPEKPRRMLFASITKHMDGSGTGEKRMNWAWTETARGEKQSQKKKKRKKEDDFIIVATLKGKRPAEASHARRRR